MFEWTSERLGAPAMSTLPEDQLPNQLDVTLESFGGGGPCEYVDGAGGICPEGKYTVKGLGYIFPNGLR